MKKLIENIAKKSLIVAFIFAALPTLPITLSAQDAEPADTTGYTDSGGAWTDLFGEAEEDEGYGKPYLFHFGNGILGTHDAECAKQIGAKVGKPFPARGINKVGDYYAAMNMVDIAKVKNGELLRGFLGSNDKLYMNADAYEYNPGKPMLDPNSFGNYGIEEGGKPKVFRL